MISGVTASTNHPISFRNITVAATSEIASVGT